MEPLQIEDSGRGSGTIKNSGTYISVAGFLCPKWSLLASIAILAVLASFFAGHARTPKMRPDDEAGLLLLPATLFPEEEQKLDPPNFGGKFYTRPSNSYTSCKAWDQWAHPVCNLDWDLPFCSMKWCQVSPECACGDAAKFAGGKMTLPDATACPICDQKHGAKETKLIFFSYLNCESGSHSQSYNDYHRTHEAGTAAVLDKNVAQCIEYGKKNSLWRSS